MVSNAGYAVADADAGHLPLTIEQRVGDSRCLSADYCAGDIIIKRTTLRRSQVTFDDDLLVSIAVLERTVVAVNKCKRLCALLEGDLPQAVAVAKSPLAEVRHRAGDGDSSDGQALETVVRDGGHGVGLPAIRYCRWNRQGS